MLSTLVNCLPPMCVWISFQHLIFGPFKALESKQNFLQGEVLLVSLSLEIFPLCHHPFPNSCQ
jgi:hypothetical protein